MYISMILTNDNYCTQNEPVLYKDFYSGESAVSATEVSLKPSLKSIHFKQN